MGLCNLVVLCLVSCSIVVSLECCLWWRLKGLGGLVAACRSTTDRATCPSGLKHAHLCLHHVCARNGWLPWGAPWLELEGHVRRTCSSSPVAKELPLACLCAGQCASCCSACAILWITTFFGQYAHDGVFRYSLGLRLAGGTSSARARGQN